MHPQMLFAVTTGVGPDSGQPVNTVDVASTDDVSALSEITDPAQQVVRWEDADRLQSQLATLSTDQRTVLQLRYWDDLSARDIAASMGRTETATRQSLHRSLVALRQSIEGNVEDDRSQARAAETITQRRRRSGGTPTIEPRPSDTAKGAGRIEPTE